MQLERHLILPLVQKALEEDLVWGDITTDSLIPPQSQSQLVLTLKQDGVVAGLEVAKEVFLFLDPKAEWQALAQDGKFLPKGTALARVRGLSRQLLKAERVALNFLQRLSGTASLTRQYVELAQAANPNVRILDTRKTTPGLRYLEKYAVTAGGGHNHRYCLSDAVLIKDNHLAILAQEGKDMTYAIQACRAAIPHTVSIELEVDRLEQIQPGLDAGVDAFLLDNMNPAQLKAAVQLIQGRALCEASGGVNLATVAAIAASGVDLISVGALTHSSPSLDISLDYL